MAAPTLRMMESLIGLYDRRLKDGAILSDAAQVAIVHRLDALARQLTSPRFRLRRLAPRGLYIHGGVGRGKSMLMDLFFQTVPLDRKQRVHFDAFMLDVHARLHRARQEGGDPLPHVIAALAAETRLLCFDEFQVNDIADAMILSRLFTGLLDRGVIVVATSNVAPDDLYRGGLQRALFLPFIALLKDRLDVVAMAGSVDHRLRRLAGCPLWITPDDAGAAREMDRIFGQLGDSQAALPAVIDIAGRRLTVPACAGHVCRFTFADLCGAALGAADYLALASRFTVIMVDHVPVLTADWRNETLRFIALVDQAYEKHCLLVVGAALPIDGTCAAGNPHALRFQRAASRLSEMQGEAYMSRGRTR